MHTYLTRYRAPRRAGGAKTRRWAWTAIVAACISSASGFAADVPPLPRFVSGAHDIDCSTTPFGLYAPMSQDVEGINLIVSPSLNAIDEYRATVAPEVPPFVRTFRTNNPVVGGTLLKAVDIDLNGDGRDEVVAAYRIADGSLRLAVLRRSGTGAGSAAVLQDSWSLNQTFSQVDLVAGDLNGSSNGRQELGVMLRTMTGAVRVYVLEGDSNGGITHADNAYAAYWQYTGPVGASVGFAAGDLLLSGHEQLVVVSELNPGTSRRIAYSILEFNPTTSALPIEPSSINIGSRTITSNVGVSFGNNILKIEADAGDVVDTAAAELVLHVQYQESGNDFIAQRLLHFPTVRDDNNRILDFSLFDRTPENPNNDDSYDSSQIIQGGNPNGPASFEATIGRVAPLKNAIILARGNPLDGDGTFTVAAYEPIVDKNAAFTFQTTGRTVNFRNTSTGGATQYAWNFGDATGVVYGVDAVHQYAREDSFTVVLTASYPGGQTRTYSFVVPVNAGANSGGSTPRYSYSLGAPAYSAKAIPANTTLPYTGQFSFVNVSAGDTNRDGTYEVVTAVRWGTSNLLRSRWQLTDPANPSSFSGTHAAEVNSAFSSMTAMAFVAADFDGDSLYGSLSDLCLQVFEPQVRQVVWLPPYFKVEQASATKLASWGQSTTGTTSSETVSGSYTSNDVSGYVGIEVGTPDNLPYTVETSIKFTTGKNWQKSKGEIHGEETSLSVDQGFYQEDGEALLISEESAYNCYAYDVRRATGGLTPNSAMRMCEPIDDSRIVSGGDALGWDTYLPAASMQILGRKPLQWFPLQRDWASLSLFRPVTTNTAFSAGNGVDKLTDGRFSSAALAGAPRNQPYVDIDLGRIRDISNIRVFPASGKAIDLRNFNVYTSRTPMPVEGLPGGTGVHTFKPETEDAVSYDRWNIWTRDPYDPSTMLRARYIRLQHPGPQAAVLNVAEIQVFGDLHLDPPSYPQAICDPVANDGFFKALVWNANATRFQEIEMRGNVLWNGSGGWPAPGPGDVFQGCGTVGSVPQRDIWSNIGVGGTASYSWNLSSESGSVTGSTTGIDTSTRFGAEFDFKAGSIVSVIGGVAYEYNSGITKETSNSMYWGSGLDIGGEIGGFTNTALNQPCRYRPRPYAYSLPDRSDTGYLHTAYVVDYIVQEGATGMWKRSGVPGQCFGDRIFADSYEW